MFARPSSAFRIVCRSDAAAPPPPPPPPPLDSVAMGESVAAGASYEEHPALRGDDGRCKWQRMLLVLLWLCAEMMGDADGSAAAIGWSRPKR